MRLSYLSCLFALQFLCFVPALTAVERVVSPQGSDAGPGTVEKPWKSLSRACLKLQAGDTLTVKAGEYRERVVIESSGSEAQGYITIQGEPGAIVSGLGSKGRNLVEIENQSYIKIIGLEIAKSSGVRDGSGIRVSGYGSHIELRKNTIHEIRGKDAMGITVYGTNSAKPIDHLVIDGNEIYDCDPAKSEALTLNGNVTDFTVTNNLVHDLNNIGIDFIGGEDGMVKDRTKVARNGLCKGNRVWRCRARYEGGYAAGIYVDGGVGITLEDNIVTECDLGLEVGAENKGTVVSGITVRNNFLYHNDKAGIVFGGFDRGAGRVQGCKFINNTCYENNRHKKDQNGELWIQWASGNEVTGNIFVSNGESPMVQVDDGGVAGNTVNHNRYDSSVGADKAPFMFRFKDIRGFANWQRVSKMDADSVFGRVEVALPTIGVK